MDKIVRKIRISLLFLLLFFAAELKAETISIPVKSADSKEIIMEVFDIAGSSMTDTGKELYYSLGEPGGITTLSAGVTGLEAGYPFCDFISPGAITNLTGLCDTEKGDVTLSWSTPGDDGWTNTLPSGSEYRIDYSTYSKQWSKDTYEVSIPTSGVAPYSEVSRKITGLTGDTTWYFQIWTRDEVPNWSGLSNGATIWVCPVLSISISTDTYNFGVLQGDTAAVSTANIIVTNDGNVKEKYSIECSTSAEWSPANSPDYNKFVLQSAFHPSEPPNDDISWKDDDILTESLQECTTYQFSIDNSENGKDVTPFANTDRHFWLRLHTPLYSNTTDQQTIPVTISADKATP